VPGGIDNEVLCCRYNDIDCGRLGCDREYQGRGQGNCDESGDFEVAEKTVLETYVRETTELLHLTINGEVIKTTFEHPFYVKDVGFVEAGKLQVGDKLVDSRGNVLVVEEKSLR